MKIRLIIGQYNCDYPGQRAPNVLDAWDENTMDDYYEGYETSLAHFKTEEGPKGDFEWVRELDIIVPDETIDRLKVVPTIAVETSTA